jgi:hypothetical protein
MFSSKSVIRLMILGGEPYSSIAMFVCLVLIAKYLPKILRQIREQEENQKKAQ